MRCHGHIDRALAVLSKPKKLAVLKCTDHSRDDSVQAEIRGLIMEETRNDKEKLVRRCGTSTHALGIVVTAGDFISSSNPQRENGFLNRMA